MSGLFKKKNPVMPLPPMPASKGPLPPPPMPAAKGSPESPVMASPPLAPPPLNPQAVSAIPRASALPNLSPDEELPPLAGFELELPASSELGLPDFQPSEPPVISKPAVENTNPVVQAIPKPVIPPHAAPVILPQAAPKRVVHNPELPAQPKPFFVKVDDYRSILEGTTLIRNNLKEADEIIARLNELKNEGDREFEKWRVKVDDAQRKLVYVDKVLFEAG